MLSWNTCCIQSGLCKLSSLSLALSVSVKPYRALSLSVFLLLTHQRTTSRLPLFAFTWSGRVLRASFFLTCCSRRTICCIESAAHICFIPRMWTVQLRFFGFYKTYPPSCVPEELLRSTDVAVLEWKLTANDSDHCKRSHFWVGQIWILRWLHHHRATPIIKAKINCAQISQLSLPPPFFFRPFPDEE